MLHQDKICISEEEIRCSLSVSTQDYPQCQRTRVLFDKIVWNWSIFRLCSGLIVTSYAKYHPDESYKTSMSKAIQQYEDYKKIYVVDEDEGNFKGISLWELETAMLSHYQQ